MVVMVVEENFRNKRKKLKRKIDTMRH